MRNSVAKMTDPIGSTHDKIFYSQKLWVQKFQDSFGLRNRCNKDGQK